ncbi:hypothetical protein, partial [Klebsiella oxytoca]
LLADGDVATVEGVLTGFLAKLRNDTAKDGAGRVDVWRIALKFVLDVLRLRSQSAGVHMVTAAERLARLELF